MYQFPMENFFEPTFVDQCQQCWCGLELTRTVTWCNTWSAKWCCSLLLCQVWTGVNLWIELDAIVDGNKMRCNWRLIIYIWLKYLQWWFVSCIQYRKCMVCSNHQVFLWCLFLLWICKSAWMDSNVSRADINIAGAGLGRGREGSAG